MPGKVIGIDLGTTHCRIAFMEQERSVVIPNAFGEGSTPNIIALTRSGQWILGRDAERLYQSTPEIVVPGITRFLGLTQSSATFQEETRACPFQFVTGENNEPTILLQGKTFTLDEILIELFRKLKWTAERYLGQEVTDSVVAVATPLVPAVDSQIRRCASVAGLQVLRIYASAVMASICRYLGLLHEGRILIFDFGGRFCNAAVVHTEDYVWEVRSVETGRHTCGNYIDRSLAAHLAIEFRKNKGIGLEGNSVALERLRSGAEKAKIILSSSEQTDLHVPLLAQDPSGRLQSLTTCLTREKMEEISSIHIEEAQEICRRTLHASGFKVEDLDEVILIGGMSRMPAVQNSFRSFFHNKLRIDGSGELVSRGAAIQGAVIKGEIKDVLLMDVIPYSVGIETLGGRFEVLIPKNETIPTRKSMILSTAHSGQSSAYLHLSMGESLWARENSTLCGLRIDVVPGPKGIAEIEVTADVDLNGVIYISTKGRKRGSKEKAIKIGASEAPPREEIARLVLESPVQRKL